MTERNIIQITEGKSLTILVDQISIEREVHHPCGDRETFDAEEIEEHYVLSRYSLHEDNLSIIGIAHSPQEARQKLYKEARQAAARRFNEDDNCYEVQNRTTPNGRGEEA